MPIIDQTSESSESRVAVPVSPAPAPTAAAIDEANEFHKLTKRSSQFMGGAIFVFLLGFLSFPILARIFSVEEYGLISLVSNTIAVAVVFSKFGLQTAVQRFFKEHAVSPEPGALRKYYSTVYLSSAGNGLIATVLFLLAVWLAPESLLSPRLRVLFAYAASLILLRSVTAMITNLLQVEGRTFAFNLLQISTKAATIAVTLILLLTWSRTPVTFFIGVVIVEAVAVLLAIPYLLHRKMLAVSVFSVKTFREIMVFGFPMMGAEIFYLLLDTGDRFLVQGYLGARQLGFYAAAYNISGYIRDSLSSPLSLALFPIVMEIWVLKGRDKTQQFLGRTMNTFVLFGVAVVVSVSACSSDAINLVASPKFNEAHQLLPYILVGMLASAISMFFRSALMIYKKTYLLMRIIMVACTVNVLMNVILLPRIGLLGAAISTVGSYVFSTSLFGWQARKYLPIHVNLLAWLRYGAVGAFSWFLASRIQIHSILLDLLVSGSVCVFIYFAILWLIDSEVRKLASSFFQSATGWVQQRLATSRA